MARITLRVLDGADRGAVFPDLSTPVTIGREDGNTIQLNDDRVSRFHLKIQEDDDQLVLTDLESTNGTRVNGEFTHLRIVRPGDVILVGRSVLLVGTRAEIRQRLAELDPNGRPKLPEAFQNVLESSDSAWDPDPSFSWDEAEDLEATFAWRQPPMLPRGLRPGQAAELAELLQYVHARVRLLLEGGHMVSRSEQVMLSQATWQNLIDLQARMAWYLRQIHEPDEASS